MAGLDVLITLRVLQGFAFFHRFLIFAYGLAGAKTKMKWQRPE